ncbi:MAG: porin family protein [Candidatus Aminicenantes bacterium]|nr:porin family protein [Candidatus Aminicenantes bacterium]
MKKPFILVVIGLVALVLTASARTEGKKWELGVGFDYSSVKSSGSTEAFDILTIPLRLGYYLWKGLEVEPELFLMKVEDSDMGYLFNLNGVYNFKTASSFRPFLLVGVGITNGVKIGYLMEADNEFNGFVFNAGAGLKYLVGNAAAIRFEYRYLHNRLKDMDITENFNSHQFLIGVSVFF